MSKSKLLDESIIDATAIKQAALKNAEQILLKNYAPVIEEQISRLLEEESDEDRELLLGQNQPQLNQDQGNPMPEMPDMGGDPSMGLNPEMDIGAETPMGDLPTPEDSSGIDGAPKEPTQQTKNTLEHIPLASEKDDNSKITINLGSATDIPNEEGKDMTDQTVVNPEQKKDGSLVEPLMEVEEPEEEDEEIDVNLKEIQDALEESIVLDMPDPSQGWSVTDGIEGETAKNQAELKDKLKEDLVCDRNLDDVNITKVNAENQEEAKEETSKDLIEEAVDIALKESVKYFDKKLNYLVKENRNLLNERTIYIQKLNELKEVLEKSNLLNIRLYYKNKVLQDPSLNERQKNQIVEAISKAENGEKVKAIYSVKNSFMGSNIKVKEKSLEELLESKNYLMTYRKDQQRSEYTDVEDQTKSKLQILAGIKKDID